MRRRSKLQARRIAAVWTRGEVGAGTVQGEQLAYEGCADAEEVGQLPDGGVAAQRGG